MSRSDTMLASVRWAGRLVLGLVITSVAATAAWAELQQPTAGDRRIVLLVNALTKRDHLNRKTQPLNDEASRRALKLFLEELDPMKLYFYQSDIDRFMKRQNDIDDMLDQGDLSLAYDIYKTFLARVDERIKMVQKHLAAKHDFTAQEEMIVDKDAAHYAQNAQEASERWRKRVKYDLLVLKAAKDDTDKRDPLERLTRRYTSFGKRMHQTDNDELLEMFLTDVTRALDPHTSYMSPKSQENFAIQMRLKLDGIGAALQYDDGYTVVTKIIPGGAADKQGQLKPKDKIIGVGQEADGEIVDTVDMKLGDVVDMIRGKRGTVVRLEVIPAGKTERKTINITRAQIELKDSEARAKIIPWGKKADGSPYQVGVIDLPSFYMDMDAARLGRPDYKSTTRDVQAILDGFRDKGVDAVLMDLRKNGGGSLTEAIKLTGLFIDEGPVVQVKDADGKVQHYDDLDKGTAWSGPLVVLTSKLSASASEIFAGAIQDYHRGLIVGDEATHGKGTVQSLLDLGQQLFRALPNAPQLGSLKITMQQFYRPNGESTQNRGVLADVALPSLISQLDIAESDLDYALPFDKVEAASFGNMNLIDPVIARKLADRSAKRREADEGFQKVLRSIKRYNERKDRKTCSLCETTFLAERNEADEDKLFDEDEDETKDEVFKMDYYDKEVLRVTVDYLELVGDRLAAK